MSRDDIKKIVYDCLIEQYYNDDIKTKLMLKSNDGEDELLYDELNFDSLDMIEFTLNVERNIGHSFIFDEDLINKEITLRKIIDFIDNKINN